MTRNAKPRSKSVPVKKPKVDAGIHLRFRNQSDGKAYDVTIDLHVHSLAELTSGAVEVRAVATAGEGDMVLYLEPDALEFFKNWAESKREEEVDQNQQERDRFKEALTVLAMRPDRLGYTHGSRLHDVGKLMGFAEDVLDGKDIDDLLERKGLKPYKGD